MSSIDAKPLSRSFRFGNNQKSRGARSGKIAELQKMCDTEHCRGTKTSRFPFFRRIESLKRFKTSIKKLFVHLIQILDELDK